MSEEIEKSRSRCTALEKKTVCFDIDILLLEKARRKFGISDDGTPNPANVFIARAIEAGVADVKTSNAIMRLVEDTMRENARKRVERRERRRSNAAYRGEMARTSAKLDEARLPAYALKIVRKLRSEGMQI